MKNIFLILMCNRRNARIFLVRNWKNLVVNQSLMVRPSAAGKGIGSSLVNYAVDIAKQCSCTAVRLDTGEQNIPAVSLYKKLGFQLVAALPMKVGGTILHNEHLFFEKMI